MTIERRMRLVVVGLLLMTICIPRTVNASTSTVVKLWIGNSTMTINGTSTAIDAQGTKPVIVDGRTLVPIRAVIEAFGGGVSWEPATRKVTVTLAKNTLDLWIGKPQASLNGQARPIDSANPRVLPAIAGGRTMLPLRFVTESLGIEVQYEATTKMITLTYSVATELPPIQSSPLTLQSGWSFVPDNYGGYVVGRVVNTSSKTVGTATIVFALLDKNGKTVAKGIDLTMNLNPGATWLFEVGNTNSDVVSAEFISLSYSGLTAPSGESSPLTLQSGWSFVPDNYGGNVVGRVVNTSSKTVGTATIVFALLDKNGKTVAKGIDLTMNLNPGDTWLFEVGNTNSDVVSAEFISVDGH